MKKLFLSMAVCAALASCTSTEDTYVGGQSEIKLMPVTSLTTRAKVTGAIDSTTYPAGENFDVFAYWKNEPAGSVFTDGTEYLINTNASGVEFMNKGAYWGGSTTYYWPKNGSLRFSAYSPADLNMVHDQANDIYTSTQIAYPTNIAETYDILVAPTSESYTAQTATDKVSVVFEHALSWITFKFKSTEAANAVFTVEGVTLEDIQNVGTLTANMTADTKTWALTGDKADVAVYAGEKDVTTSVEIFETLTSGNGVLVLPQATTSLTIAYTQKGVNGTPTLTGQSVNVPLILDGANTPWEPGKHYIYTVIFDLDEILINPSVADWEDVNVPVIDATALEVSAEDELISAIAAGKSVRLINDIEVNQPIVVNGGDVIVELNGKNITSSVDGFEVKAGTLSINGPGKVSAASANGEPYCAVWAYGDAVVNIYGGEFEAGYPAGDYNDLIYAKENAQINIYGGVFYNSGKENAFVLNLKDADKATAAITVYGGTFYGFNPADNASENPAVNFVAAGYNVVASTKDGAAVYTVCASENAAIVLDAATTITKNVTVTNGTLDGKGNTLTAAATPSDNGMIRPAGDVIIQNVTINGENKVWNDNGTERGLRAIYINAAGNYVVDNVTIENVTYAINVNTTKEVSLEVKNSTLQGWTSYGTSTTASFVNVAFTKGTQATFRPYGTTILSNCSFEAGFTIDLAELGAGETIVFEGCTYGGAALTTDNLTGYTGKESFVTVR